MTRYEARSLIGTYAIPICLDFFTLTPQDVERVLVIADLVKYRKPINMHGSRARVFYAYLMKQAEY